MNSNESSLDFGEADVPEILQEGLQEINEVEDFLKDRSATGILIGGKAYAFLAGQHELEVEKRKDTDVLVVAGGEMMGQDSPYDLFLPDEKGVYRNRNEFTLPYHIHYLGRRMKPGLYLPPPEVVYLVEAEMATRRAIDRVIPGIIRERYSPMARRLKMLKKEDVVVEFPGDFSWFGQAKPNFPMQVSSRDEEGGRRTFISFKWRNESQIPRSVFPSVKDVRVPEIDNINGLNQVDLSSEEYYEIGIKMIQSGFMKEGIEYLSKNAPEKLDSPDILDRIFGNMDDYPLKCAEALIMWLRIAKEHKFIYLFLMQFFNVREGTENKVKELGEMISSEYGNRFIKLSEWLIGFKLEDAIPDEMPEVLKEFMRELFQKPYGGIYGLSKASIKLSGGKNYEFKADQEIFINTERSGDLLFNDLFYGMSEELGITDAEAVKMFYFESFHRKVFDFARRVPSYGDENPIFLYKKRVKSGKTLLDFMSENPNFKDCLLRLVKERIEADKTVRESFCLWDREACEILAEILGCSSLEEVDGLIRDIPLLIG